MKLYRNHVRISDLYLLVAYWEDSQGVELTSRYGIRLSWKDMFLIISYGHFHVHSDALGRLPRLRMRMVETNNKMITKKNPRFNSFVQIQNKCKRHLSPLNSCSHPYSRITINPEASGCKFPFLPSPYLVSSLPPIPHTSHEISSPKTRQVPSQQVYHSEKLMLEKINKKLLRHFICSFLFEGL